MSKNRENHTPIAPLHMQYPDRWNLGYSGPEGAKACLQWIFDDPERLQSATESFRELGIGMHFLTVAQKLDEYGDVEKKIELNFWSEEFEADQTAAGGHAHSRDMELWSFVHPKARQEVRGITLLPEGTRRLSGLPVEERQLAILNKVDTGDGLGTIYHPVPLSERLSLEAVTHIPPGTHQRYSSLFIHEVGFKGPGVGVSVQRQGHTEQRDLNTFEGFTTYKGLTKEEAEEVLRQRKKVAKVGNKVVTSTILLRDLDFNPDEMEERAQPVPAERYVRLAEEAIRSIEKLIKDPVF